MACPNAIVVRTPAPTAVPGIGARFVPDFPGGNLGVHINHGFFWANQSAILPGGRFFWDCWIKQGDHTQTGYVVSDGYGGQHAILFGTSGGVVSGNVWNGTALTSFGGGYLINNGEWAYVAVCWDGSNIYTYVNGIVDGKVAFPASPGRFSVPAGQGGGVLYVGGSDHNNFKGRIAFLRAWEDLDAFGAGATDIRVGWIPQHFPGRFSSIGGAQAVGRTPCNFYCDYTASVGGTQHDTSPLGSLVGNILINTTVTTGVASATQTVGSTAGMYAGATLYFATAAATRTISSVTNTTTVVLSSTVTTTTGETVVGLSAQTPIWHHGRPMKVSQVGLSGVGALQFQYGPQGTRSELAGGPVWVRDPTCPLWRAPGTTPSGETVPAKLPIPAGCKIFDGPSRPNQTFAFQNEADITVGSTEGGILGPLVWQQTTPNTATRPKSWGILGGYFVCLNLTNGGIYVMNDSPDMDARVTRRFAGTDTIRQTGLLFRVVDANNFWTCDYDNVANLISLRTVTANGAPANVQTYTPPNTSWRDLRVVTAGTSITAYVGDGAGTWTALSPAVTNATFQTGLGVGVGTGLTTGSSQWNTGWRATNFQVY